MTLSVPPRWSIMEAAGNSAKPLSELDSLPQLAAAPVQQQNQISTSMKYIYQEPGYHYHGCLPVSVTRWAATGISVWSTK
jgi:hypothetical protein